MEACRTLTTAHQHLDPYISKKKWVLNSFAGFWKPTELIWPYSAQTEKPLRPLLYVIQAQTNSLMRNFILKKTYFSHQVYDGWSDEGIMLYNQTKISSKVAVYSISSKMLVKMPSYNSRDFVNSWTAKNIYNSVINKLFLIYFSWNIRLSLDSLLRWRDNNLVGTI